MFFPDKLRSVFERHASRHAFCIKNTYYTYAELAAKMASIQQELKGQCGDEQNVGIIIKDDIETYASLIAVLLSGKTYIPIHSGYPAERVMQVLEQSGLKVILSATREYNYPGIMTIATAGLSADPEELDSTEFVTDTNAYILFTSGSTGVPKGVPITYHNLDSFMNAFQALGYELDEHDRFLQMFDLTFDLSVMSYLVPLCLGACVYTIPDTGMKFTNIFNVLTKHEITCALMVPSILASLRPYFSEIDLPSVKYSLFCGEALYTKIVAEWMACVPNAIIENVYGPTEATIFCLTYPVSRLSEIADNNGIVAIGKPMEGMEAIVVGDELQEVADGEKGELCLHGKQLTPGYLDPERSKASFFEYNGKKYYRTGDISSKNKDGNFVYCGRVDHQVKVQGFRVELSEIEFHVRDITGRANVAALTTTSDAGVTQISVVIEGGHIDEEVFMDQLKTKLPPYMMPARLYCVAAFPLNVNGKTDRNALGKLIQQ